jgi:hypothetical protein
MGLVLIDASFQCSKDVARHPSVSVMAMRPPDAHKPQQSGSLAQTDASVPPPPQPEKPEQAAAQQDE